MSDDRVERVAMAMADAGSNERGYFARVSERTRHVYRRMARAALAELEKL